MRLLIIHPHTIKDFIKLWYKYKIYKSLYCIIKYYFDVKFIF